uniref:Uncharacterized protein n=1 Tax=Arundo donax TaxID=35708 RepID=A0A0A9DRH5_ARUDO
MHVLRMNDIPQNSLHKYVESHTLMRRNFVVLIKLLLGTRWFILENERILCP